MAFGEPGSKKLRTNEAAKIREVARSARPQKRWRALRGGLLKGFRHFGADLESLGTDMGPDGREKRGGARPSRAQEYREGLTDDIGDGSPPARMHGERGAARWIGDQERNTICRPHKNTDARCKRDKRIGLETADELSIAFGTDKARSMNLMHLEGSRFIDPNGREERRTVRSHGLFIIAKPIGEVERGERADTSPAAPR